MFPYKMVSFGMELEKICLPLDDVSELLWVDGIIACALNVTEDAHCVDLRF